MTLTHPLQQLTVETSKWLMFWSRLVFWIVLGLYAYIKCASMGDDAQIFLTPLEKRGALGFWAGYDYLFMLSYSLFFAVCCVWGAGLLKAGSFFYNLGIALAWAMIPLLLIDMTENWCIWQIALGKSSTGVKNLFECLKWPKIILFAGASTYALVVSILKWRKVI